MSAAGGIAWLRALPVAAARLVSSGAAGLRALARHPDQAFHLVAADGFMLQQRPGYQVEPVAVLGEGRPAPVLLLAQDALDLLVDYPGRVVAVVAGLHQVLA